MEFSKRIKERDRGKQIGRKNSLKESRGRKEIHNRISDFKQQNE